MNARMKADEDMKIIIIAGMPASGKSTFAVKLGKALELPVLEKDAIKEELFDTIGFRQYSEKRLLDVAATAVLIRTMDMLLDGKQSLIVVNNFRDISAAEVQRVLKKHACKCVTVFFKGDADVFYRRYIERDNKHLRHLGHILQDRYPPEEGDCIDYEMSRSEFADKFEKLGMADFKLDTPCINVDATYPEKIDVNALISQICNALI